nr:unnamed protein product [Callosobruchus chinensis]
MATGGGTAKPAHSPNPAVDMLVPYLEYEIDVRDDLGGIQLSQVRAELGVDASTFIVDLDVSTMRRQCRLCRQCQQCQQWLQV